MHDDKLGRLIAALKTERDRYRTLYEQERADRKMLQQVVRSQAITIETQKVMLGAQQTGESHGTRITEPG